MVFFIRSFGHFDIVHMSNVLGIQNAPGLRVYLLFSTLRAVRRRRAHEGTRARGYEGTRRDEGEQR